MVSPPESSDAAGRIHPDAAEAPPSAAFQEAARHLRAAAGYAWFYVRTRVDRIGHSLRDLIGFAAVLVTGLFMCAALLVTAVVLVCHGIAETLTALFGGRVWLGDLVTGVSLLVGVAVVIYLLMRHVEKLWKQRTMRVYARLKRRQRAAHGIDVDQRANQ